MPDVATAPAVGDLIHRSFACEVLTGQEGQRVTRDAGEDPIVMRFSSGRTPDRHGTIFDMDGAELGAYRKNPILRWAHGKGKKGRVPIGRAIPSIRDGDLVAALDFDEEDEFARKIESKLRRGFLNTGSIAAEPLEKPTMRRMEGRRVPVFERWELRGLSIVDIPSDPDATALSRDARGATAGGAGARRHTFTREEAVAAAAGAVRAQKARKRARVRSVVEAALTESRREPRRETRLRRWLARR